MKWITVRTLVLAAAGWHAAGGRVAAAAENAVIFWNQTACDTVVAAGLDPMTNSRVFAILHGAAHDALNSIDRRYETYLYSGTTRAEAVPQMAVAAAARAVLVNLVPTQKANVEAIFGMAMRSVPEGPGKAEAIRLGTEAAMTILARRQYDGSSAEVRARIGTQPGEYRPTPTLLIPPFGAQWGKVTPFAMYHPAQFRPKAPPPLGGQRYTADYREVALIGQDTSQVRTEEQSLIARHWYENSTEGWNRIARVVASHRNLNLWESARLFALLNIAVADGFIGGFEAKYHYNFWRPVTAIREGDADGNGETISDRDWLPFLETPPVPDYPSTHSVLGASAATVLGRFFGTDLVPFEFTSGAPFAGTVRRYWGFSEAAHENAMSRVLAGIHFRSAVEAGLTQGYEIGEFVSNEILRPVR